MQLSKGTLLLVKSKNPPVFGTSPVAIEYKEGPLKGEPFFFRRADHGVFDGCNLSTVQKVSRIDGVCLVKTLNSLYVLIK